MGRITCTAMKFSLLSTLAALLSTTALHADPQLSSWRTASAGKYARIYTTDANKLAGNSVTTWTNGTQNQAAPAYCGTAQFTIPAGAATGAQTVTVIFPGPPGNPGATVTYTLAGGFTVN